MIPTPPLDTDDEILAYCGRLSCYRVCRASELVETETGELICRRCEQQEAAL